MRQVFSTEMKLEVGQTSPEVALGTAEYPASGSFIDTRGYEWVNVIVHLGAIHGSDTPVFELQQSDSVSGTMDVIDATNCKKTCLATDDDQVLMFYLETATLADDHFWITMDVSLATNGSYAAIIYLLGGTRHQPVTQDTTLLPSDNQLIRAG